MDWVFLGGGDNCGFSTDQRLGPPSALYAVVVEVVTLQSTAGARL